MTELCDYKSIQWPMTDRLYAIKSISILMSGVFYRITPTLNSAQATRTRWKVWWVWKQCKSYHILEPPDFDPGRFWSNVFNSRLHYQWSKHQLRKYIFEEWCFVPLVPFQRFSDLCQGTLKTQILNTETQNEVVKDQTRGLPRSSPNFSLWYNTDLEYNP